MLKFTNFILSTTLFQTSYTSYTGMTEKWAILKRQHVTSLMIEIGGAGTTATDSQKNEVSSVLNSNLDQLDNYGCWCYFDEDISLGRGKSVDHSDTACKKMANRMKCVMKVHTECSGERLPWAIDYRMKTEKGPRKMINTCEKLNRNDLCATYACLIEAQFLEEVFDLAVAVNFTDSRFLHGNGDFDPVGSCKGKNEVNIQNSNNFRNIEFENENLGQNNGANYRAKVRVEENDKNLEVQSRKEIILAQRGISSKFHCAA